MTWKSLETSQTKSQGENRSGGLRQNIQGLQNNFKRYNIHAVGIAEGDEKVGEEILKMVSKNFPKLTDFKLKTHENQRRLRKINTK